MKLNIAHCLVIACMLHTEFSSAATSLTMDFGSLKDSAGAELPDGSLLVLIANSSTVGGALPGGLTDHSASGGLDAGLAFNHFKGKTLQVGALINLDKIIYVGSVNGLTGYGAGYDGIAFDNNVPIDYTDGVALGQNFGLYWFPGLTAASNTVSLTGFEIGGFFNSDANLGDIGMTLPGDGLFNVIQRDSAAAALDGATSTIIPSAFNAISVPEPSAFALCLVGLVALLRRHGK